MTSFPTSTWPSRSCAPSRPRATPRRRRSRRRPSRSSWKAGPAGHRPDRHRQDGGLRAAAPAAPGRGQPAPAAALPRAPGPDADPRAGDPDRRILRHLRPPRSPEPHRRLRRRRPEPAGAGPGARRRRPGRHAGPPARPDRTGHMSSSTASRPSCSTRPTACSTWASSTTCGASSPAAEAAPDAAVLRHHAGGGDRSSPTAAARPGTRRGDAGRRRRPSASSSACCSSRRRTSAHCWPSCCRTTSIERALVFTRTKHGANRVAEQLDEAGVRADAIHGNKSQNARQRALEDFRAGKVRVLVATDIAARGIDVDGITPRDQLRPAERAGELRPSHRPHRARRGHEASPSRSATPRSARILRDIEKTIRQPVPVDQDHPFHAAHIANGRQARRAPARPANRQQQRPPRHADERRTPIVAQLGRNKGRRQVQVSDSAP